MSGLFTVYHLNLLFLLFFGLFNLLRPLPFQIILNHWYTIKKSNKKWHNKPNIPMYFNYITSKHSLAPHHTKPTPKPCIESSLECQTWPRTYSSSSSSDLLFPCLIWSEVVLEAGFAFRPDVPLLCVGREDVEHL